MTEENYPFVIKPNFSTLGSLMKIEPKFHRHSNWFPLDDSIRNVLGFDAVTLYEKYNLSQNPVYILSFDNIFLETDVAHGMIFKVRRSGIFHNWTMTVDSRYKYVEKFTGGISWYMMESKSFFPSYTN